MKKYIYLITLAVVAAMSATSCDLETSDNGDLDGFWHLVQVDTLDTGGTCNMKEARIYWSFQCDVLKLDDKTERNRSIIMRFDNRGEQMTLFDPYIYDRGAGDIKLEDINMLRPFGINAMSETFNVSHLSSHNMIIESPMLRLSFKKM